MFEDHQQTRTIKNRNCGKSNATYVPDGSFRFAREVQLVRRRELYKRLVLPGEDSDLNNLNNNHCATGISTTSSCRYALAAPNSNSTQRNGTH